MNTDKVPVGLEQVRAELDAWRGQRRKGDRIPEEVWRRAACAVRQYGLNTVSRALRLDYYHLKIPQAGTTRCSWTTPAISWQQPARQSMHATNLAGKRRTGSWEFDSRRPMCRFSISEEARWVARSS